MPGYKPINLFLSYGTDSGYFADSFRKSYLGGKDNFIRPFDWQSVQGILPGAGLEISLRGKIDETDVFVAFLDESYNSDERRTRLELTHALTTLQRRGGHLRIVLLLLSPESKSILDELESQHGEIIKDLVAERCYDEKGIVSTLDKNPKLHQRVVALREKHLNELRNASSPTKTLASELSAVVMLDRAIVPDGEVVTVTSEGSAASAAGSLLQAAGARVFQGQVGWHSRLDLNINLQEADLRQPAFVQVLSSATAPMSIQEPGILARRLSSLTSQEVIRRSLLAYWLPEGGQRTSSFETLLRTKGESSPAFRGDSAEGLADWLKPKLRLGLPSPVAAYLDVDDMHQHRNTLRREVAAVVESALPEVPDDRELHAFDAKMLKEILSALAKRRPIIVAHNLRLNNTNNPQTLRKETIKYFRSFAMDADDALKEMNVDPEEVFWLAIVQEGNPIVTSASLSIPLSDFKLSRWFVLGLTQSISGDLRLERGARRVAIVQRLLAWSQRAALTTTHA
jgi:hypothetical protein